MALIFCMFCSFAGSDICRFWSLPVLIFTCSDLLTILIFCRFWFFAYPLLILVIVGCYFFTGAYHVTYSINSVCPSGFYGHGFIKSQKLVNAPDEMDPDGKRPPSEDSRYVATSISDIGREPNSTRNETLDWKNAEETRKNKERKERPVKPKTDSNWKRSFLR